MLIETCKVPVKGLAHFSVNLFRRIAFFEARIEYVQVPIRQASGGKFGDLDGVFPLDCDTCRAPMVSILGGAVKIAKDAVNCTVFNIGQQS
jgi:hypothetical protein